MKKLYESFAKFARRKNADNKIRTPRSIANDEFDEFTSSMRSSSNSIVSGKMIAQLTADADNGQPSELVSFFGKVLEREGAISANLQTRILSVLACDWSIKCDDRKKADETSEMLRNAGIQNLLRHLLDAIVFGYSASAVIWEEGGRAIREFRRIDHANIVFDLAGNPALAGLDGKEKAFSEYHENQFIFHTHNLNGSTPAKCGLMRPLLWLYFFKHYAMRDRARYLERFGIPFIAAKIRSEDFESPSLRSEIMNSLSRISSDGVGLLSEGSELEIVNPPSSSSSDYQTYLDYLDSMCALLILGQTASSGSASGFSKGQIQENVRRDIIEADARNLMETVEKCILRPYEKWRYGTSGKLRFELDYASGGSLLEKAQIVRELASAGIRISSKWAEKTFGVETETETENSREPLKTEFDGF